MVQFWRLRSKQRVAILPTTMINFCPRCATPTELRPFEGTPRPTCPACGYVHFADPKVAATVLLACGDQILLTRRAVDPQRGLWSFSGGYVDFGEDPQDAARRECREELGVDLHELRLLDVQLAGQVIVITYVAVLMVPVTPVPTDDIDRAEWFAPDDLPPLAFPTVVRASERWRGTTKQ